MKGLTAEGLAQRIGISKGTLYKNLSGERPMTENRVSALRRVLCDTPEEIARFDSKYQASGLPRSASDSNSAAGAIDEVDGRFNMFRVASLDYWPFAGKFDGKLGFMEKFLGRCMKLAVIPIEEKTLGRDPGTETVRFDMKARIEAVEKWQVDILYNLISLQRMKSLHFIPTPIRVAINGVILKSQAEALGPNDEPRIRAARKLLVSGLQPAQDPFVVVTVREEVGHVFVEQSHQLTEIRGEIRKEALGLACLKPQETLNPSALATTLTDLNLVNPTMLVCDEHTALGVVRALGGSGVLLLPPNSDQAVIHSYRRRSTPAYYWGMGMRRLNNWPLVDYLSQTLATFLSLEAENIAELYERLYYDLVEYVTECLTQTGIYIGGMRRTNERVNDLAPVDPTEATMYTSERLTLVEQNARALARRSLSLSRRSIENLPPELSSWKHILKRARERIQIAHGVNRGSIRNVILICAKLALGKDPLKVDTRPIALLRQLSPPKASTTATGRQASQDTSTVRLGHSTDEGVNKPPQDHWRDFLYLMEQELDMDLHTLNEWAGKDFGGSYQLGRFISEIQGLLEASPDSQVVIAIRNYDSSEAKHFQDLCVDYATRKKVPEMAGKILADLSGANAYLAFNLGEPVGFIVGKAIQCDLLSIPQWPSTPETGDEVIQVQHLHVAERMQKADVSRRLVRRVVEEGNDTRKRGVVLRKEDWRQGLESFLECGFAELSGTGYLGYELKHI